MRVTDLALPGVKLIEPTYFEDYRGYYCETYSQRTLAEYGICNQFVQDNHFLSLKKGTIRGIHFQNEPYAQSKLLRCTKGKLMDIVVDLRKGSPTYKQWISVELSAENRRQIYIPKGYGHACISLTDYTEGQYKVDALYAPEYDRAIAWNDPELAIDWGTNDVIVSEKDKNAPYLKDSDVNFVYSEARIKRAIVTGASGFIGKALTKKLLDLGYTVYGVVRDKSRLREIQSDRLIVLEADLSEYPSLPDKIADREIDVFYHLAWDGTFGESFKDYHKQLKNAACAGDALTAAIQMGCKRFVLAGTIVELEVKKQMNTDDCKPRTSCIYGTAKAAAEMLCKTLAYQNGIAMNTAILASVYGVGDHSNMIQNVLLKAFQTGESPKLINGENLYDWIYIDDAADGLIAIGEKGDAYKTYYVGHRMLRSFEDLVTETRDIVAPQVKLKFGELKDMTDTDYSLIDLDALYRDTGFECQCDFRDSILKTAEWVKSLDS